MSSLTRGAVPSTPRYASATPHNSFRTLRPAILSFSKLLLPFLGWASTAAGFPHHKNPMGIWENSNDTEDPSDPSMWAYIGTAGFLVLLGGAFAGLTIALMGQDEIYLQVIATSGEGSEKKNAKKVLRLLKKGKHWVLVTLLLGNVITNETLPIVLDRCLGGGWPAVLGSTVLIVIFGEIVPQSVCVRYGLPIGAWAAPFVLALMWIMFPVAWPTAKLLDKLLGEDHGTTYKKAGLKTLVTLHKTLGDNPTERLNQDEVTIISAVLDLKAKSVGSIMTPMSDVFTLSADTILDEEMMDKILSAGYSRIPIYQPDNSQNFVGMLLVKMLIVYDPEDALRVRDFALATLPETRPETSCLDIVNFFQEGKSHMVLVSDYPGDPYGALGVVTLEDVIEELIGEHKMRLNYRNSAYDKVTSCIQVVADTVNREIIDESDVFVDVHKAIRRMHPAPRTRVPKGEVVTDPEPGTQTLEEGYLDHPSHHPHHKIARKTSVSGQGPSPKGTTFTMRRWSSGDSKPISREVQLKSNTAEARQHLRHLGPSNAANKPKSTRISAVKIKTPGLDANGTNGKSGGDSVAFGIEPRSQSVSEIPSSFRGGMGEGLLSGAGRDASDGVLALQQGYGTISKPAATPDDESIQAVGPPTDAATDATTDAATNAATNVEGQAGVPAITESSVKSKEIKEESPKDTVENPTARADKIIPESSKQTPDGGTSPKSTDGSRSPYRHHGAARSGSITENLVDVGGVKKIVLDMHSSDDAEGTSGNGLDQSKDLNDDQQPGSSTAGDKKKKRKKRGKKGKSKGDGGESEPLLGSKS